MSPAVLYVVNGLDAGSSPATEARAVDKHTEYDAGVLAWFSETGNPVEGELPTRCLEATGLGVDGETLRAVRRTFADYDLVHTFHPHSAIFAKLVAAAFGMPSVFSAFTVFDRYNLAGRVVNGATNWLAAAVTYNSSTVRDSATTVERLLNRPDHVVYNGVDLDIVRSGIETGEPFEHDGPVVAAAGRFIPEKGYESLIRAMEDVPATLAIAGDGPLADRYREVAGPDVRFLGMLSRADAIRLMYDADVFVQPSTEEGFATSPLEAMAAGTPCVLSEIQAFTEPFPRSAAFWTPPGSVEGIRSAVEDALENGAETATVARSIVEAEYTLEATAHRYAEIYDRIV